LAERLVGDGVSVRGTTRRPLAQTFEVSETSKVSTKVSTGVEIVRAGLSDAESLRRAADGCRVGGLFVLAAGQLIECGHGVARFVHPGIAPFGSWISRVIESARRYSHVA